MCLIKKNQNMKRLILVTRIEGGIRIVRYTGNQFDGLKFVDTEFYLMFFIKNN